MLTMSVERVVRGQAERKRRLEAARAAAAALVGDELLEFFAELYERVEAVAKGPGAAETSELAAGATEASIVPEGHSKTDAAEALVPGHPNGVTTAEVGSRIGQSPETADSTLRHV